MERWIQMHYQIKERERALEISKAREFFYWFTAFYNVSLVGLIYRFVLGEKWFCEMLRLLCFDISVFENNFFFQIFRYKVTKRTTNLMPIVPFTFILAYTFDSAYGSKFHRIRGLFTIFYFTFECFFSYSIFIAENYLWS